MLYPFARACDFFMGSVCGAWAAGSLTGMDWFCGEADGAAGRAAAMPWPWTWNAFGREEGQSVRALPPVFAGPTTYLLALWLSWTRTRASTIGPDIGSCRPRSRKQTERQNSEHRILLSRIRCSPMPA
jgi:hypothetical protein